MRTRSIVHMSALVLAALGCHDDTDSPLEPRAAPQAEVAAATALVFWQVSAGGGHSCGITTDYQGYCWGNNGYGQLGTLQVAVPGSVPWPVPLGGTVRFRQVSTGVAHTCGVTVDERAYCWGWNESGQLGDGTTTDRRLVTPVAGARRFRQVAAGYRHTCGVTTDGRIFCWGANESGQLGNRTTTGSLRPVAVAGARQWRQVAASEWKHTCGVTTDNRAFCWGDNQYGQVGDSTEVPVRLKPTRVAGGYQFRRVDAGGSHSCAVTTNDRAYCWGNGWGGALGNGKRYLSFWPRAVSGGLHFSRLTLGDGHVCGETTGNRAYCWGANDYGQLGDGTAPYNKDKPVPVAGGLYFNQLSAGSAHTCGKTPSGVAYCWGAGYGGVGDGTYENRLTPVRVMDPM